MELIPKPSYLIKLKRGGQIQKYFNGGRYGSKKSQTNQQRLLFNGDAFQSAYKAGKQLGWDHDTCVKMAKFAVTHWSYESGYGGSNLAVNDQNYGGYTNGQKFKNLDDFALNYMTLMNNYYPSTLSANNLKEYTHSLYNGVEGRKYCTSKPEAAYYDKLEGCRDRSQYGIDWWLQNNSKTPNPNFVMNKKYH